jgi:hypothetical protein
MTRLARWLGWRWLAIVLQRADGRVATLTLPHDLPLSVRSNTDGSVGITVGHDDDGEALLADLQGLMGGRDEHPARLDRKAGTQA